ncbi:MAG: hypothetical protein JO297_01375 [Nitrososphaeraceae archaeon]|nr:hypothetical protein [Nitrososphaeraceae archaeon]
MWTDLSVRKIYGYNIHTLRARSNYYTLFSDVGRTNVSKYCKNPEAFKIWKHITSGKRTNKNFDAFIDKKLDLFFI